ncbi:hypothetical protein [Candidatus Sororendozoicomonas aggregata]|uniref:hypothetical protein n=1 Tax=Candidatus Sororendozoicomonas aggregata TaxID=3073239 RepID=UPI002ED55F30
MFTHIAFCHGARFQNLDSSKKTFTLVRDCEVSYYNGDSVLDLKLKEDSNIAGVARIVGQPSDPVNKKERSYTLSDIMFYQEFQRFSLGSLLLYIINTEIRLNGGDCLYIESPAASAFGFYLRLGFIPDPHEAREKENGYRLSQFSGSSNPDDRKFYLDRKLKMSRKYSYWKGYTELLNTKLCEKMCEKFKYLKPV